MAACEKRNESAYACASAAQPLRAVSVHSGAATSARPYSRGSADAFVVAGPGDPYHPRALRISRGSLFRMPMVRFDSNEELLTELKDSNVEAIAAVTKSGQNVATVEPTADSRWAICVGSEAFGLDDTLVGEMDRVVSIPMAEGVDSYSVHAAAAILLYALRIPGNGST